MLQLTYGEYRPIVGNLNMNAPIFISIGSNINMNKQFLRTFKMVVFFSQCHIDYNIICENIGSQVIDSL